MPGVQYGSNARFLIETFKKKPPTKAVVKRLNRFSRNFYSAPQFVLNQRLSAYKYIQR